MIQNCECEYRNFINNTPVLLKKKVLDDPFWGQNVRFGLNQIEGVRNCKIIDMGCGKGFLSVFFALHGALVLGFDISMKDLKSAKQMAAHYGVQDTCLFFYCFAEQMALKKETIDIVFSRSTFQYMDKEYTLRECIRILKKDGVIILNENLRYNPFLVIYRLYRKLMATRHHNIAYVKSIHGYLTFSYLLMIKERFSFSTHNEYHLFRVFSLKLGLQFKHSSSIKMLDRLLTKLDGFIFNTFPFSKRFAWFITIIGKEKKAP